MRVCVAGAGIVGISTALEVQHRWGSKVELTVLGSGFNEETTGHGSAGFFCPASYFNGPDLQTTKKWIRDSYQWYNDICFSDQAIPAGIAQISGYEFSNISRENVENHLMCDVAAEFRPATEEELLLHPKGAKYGTYMTTLMVECRYLLPWAIDKIQRAGGKVRRQHINSWASLVDDFDVIFNCTGLGAGKLCQDFTLVPVRGQVYKVSAPWIKTFFCDDNDTYVFPGREVVTLGGSRWLGNSDCNIDPYESQRIWERCVGLVPSLARAKVLQQWVGLRPYRSPVRVEAENFASIKMIHNYGHGGYGVTSAPGTAKHAVNLLDSVHRSSGFASKL